MKKTNLNIADLLFDVENVENEDVVCNSNCTNDIYVYPTIVNKDADGVETEEVTKIKVNSCSSRYTLIPNSDIFPKIEQLFRIHKIEYEVNYEMRFFAEFEATFIIMDARYAFHVDMNNDIVYPMLKVKHSYNGMKKYNLLFGYFRLVCSNGLTIAVDAMKQYNLNISGKHTESINASIKQLDDKLAYFADNALDMTNSLTKSFKKLATSYPADVNMRITETLKIAGITAIENNKFNTIEYVNGIIENERKNMGLNYKGINDWLIYNGINQYLFNDTLNIAATEIREAKDQKVFEYLLKMAA